MYRISIATVQRESRHSTTSCTVHDKITDYGPIQFQIISSNCHKRKFCIDIIHFTTTD